MVLKASASQSSAKPKPRTRAKTQTTRGAVARVGRGADKRKLVMEAALELFSRYGLHGTSIDQVAARSGVSKSNLLYYFSSKEDLYVNVLQEVLYLWLTPLDELHVDDDPREAIANYIRSKLAISRDRPEASRLFCLEVVQGAPLLRDTLEGHVREITERKSAVLSAWMDKGWLVRIPPHHLLFTIWATTQHYADFAAQIEAAAGKTLNDPAFFEETVKAVQDIVLAGICVPPEGQGAEKAQAEQVAQEEKPLADPA